MPDDYLGVTDGANAIWLDRGMLQVERRCALAHELAHIDLGHRHGTPSPRDEEQATRLTAIHLIEWNDLLDAFRWSYSALEAADELWVVPEVLEDRLRFLAPHERALLAHISARRDDLDSQNGND